MQLLRLRVMRATDLSDVLRLNNSAAPTIHPLDTDEVDALYHLCDVSLVATNRRGQVSAFLLSMSHGHPYASPNYRWFEDRHTQHQYIDRIVVAAEARGTGVGRAMYESVFERARERGAMEVTTEVSLNPRDHRSWSFHEALGFRQVGEQDGGDGRAKVALLARTVNAR